MEAKGVESRIGDLSTETHISFESYLLSDEGAKCIGNS